MSKLLVVEDRSPVMKLIRLTLMVGYKLVEATTAEEALLLFLDNGQQIDLLLTDVSLSKRSCISGIEMALLLRSRLRRLPIILTSTSPVSRWNAKDSSDLDRLGGLLVRTVLRPFALTALPTAVRQLLDESLPDNSGPRNREPTTAWETV